MLYIRLLKRKSTTKGDNMKIGIDMDGVLTDLESWQLDYGSKFYYEKFGKNAEKTNLFDFLPISVSAAIIDFAKYNIGCPETLNR